MDSAEDGPPGGSQASNISAASLILASAAHARAPCSCGEVSKPLNSFCRTSTRQAQIPRNMTSPGLNPRTREASCNDFIADNVCDLKIYIKMIKPPGRVEKVGEGAKKMYLHVLRKSPMSTVHSCLHWAMEEPTSDNQSRLHSARHLCRKKVKIQNQSGSLKNTDREGGEGRGRWERKKGERGEDGRGGGVEGRGEG